MKKIIGLTLTLVGLLGGGCESRTSSALSSTSSALPAAAPAPAEASEGAIRFLEARVKGDPDDFVALNKLGGYYLLRLRETGSLTWLALARRTAQASLKAIPAEQNVGGLSLLAQTEFAAHEFAAARDHARRLSELESHKDYPYQILGDALLELGDYAGAEQAFRQMEKRGASYATTIRQARMAALRGDNERARQLYTVALQQAAEIVPPARETLAWLRWQLGETAFGIGDYQTAEQHYQAALTTFPAYYRAHAGLGRVRAARGDLAGAIEQYEQAIKLLPDPGFIATLGDLYQLAGRNQEAEAQYALCEQMARLDQANGQLYDRQRALFYADHDLKADEAYQLARREYEARRDIYGADALAWTALKAGQLYEAQRLSKEALRLGTQDARLFYHAGMIARATGDRTTARDYLKRALQLSPQFDPRQAPIAKQALAE